MESLVLSDSGCSMDLFAGLFADLFADLSPNLSMVKAKQMLVHWNLVPLASALLLAGLPAESVVMVKASWGLLELSERLELRGQSLARLSTGLFEGSLGG